MGGEERQTFFSTDEETLGNGMGWSLSPTSEGDEAVRYEMAGVVRGGVPTFEHILDEDAALSDFLVDDELLIIGGDEENHGVCGGKRERRRWRRGEENGKRPGQK